MAMWETHHGLIRFGYGPRPGEADRLDGAIRQAIAGTIEPGSTPADTSLSAARARQILALRTASAEERAARIAEARETLMAEMADRLTRLVTSPDALRERLVSFWSNHFAVSTTAPPIVLLAKPYEDEAIRPHVFGRFRDMLGAVVRHPAMLLYLDNAQSFGPNSPIGQRTGRGLNENLARELMELHTLGIDGGYSQGDVTALAAILTGWSIARPQDPNAGQFHFYAIGHEPGAKRFLGQTIPAAGQAEGERALDMLAAHPATARHIATKLARHFIADDPPPAVVDRLADAFQATDGDLAALVGTLVAAPEAWDDPLAKVRAPLDFMVAALRALGVNSVDQRAAQGLALMGQPLWRPPAPTGWPDRADDWLSPEALMRRIDVSTALANVVGGRIDPRTLLDQTLGPLAGAETRFQINGAASRQDGLALLLAAPEFQRR